MHLDTTEIKLVRSMAMTIAGLVQKAASVMKVPIIQLPVTRVTSVQRSLRKNTLASHQLIARLDLLKRSDVLLASTVQAIALSST